jgi:VanZ family protein
MGVIYHFSGQTWSGGNTSSWFDSLLNMLFPQFARKITPEQLEWFNFWIRKGAHFTEFAILTWLGYRAWLIGARQPALEAAKMALACSILYAIIDEFHQAFVPGRMSNPVDIGIDALGALFAYLLIRRWRSVRRGASPESPDPLDHE